MRQTRAVALLLVACMCTAHAADGKAGLLKDALNKVTGAKEAAAAHVNAKVNEAAEAAQAAAEAGAGTTEWFLSAVGGRLYDAADPLFLWAPVQENATEFHAAECSGAGFCFPQWSSPDYVWPKIGCAAGYQLNKLGKCVLRAYRKVDACFFGPLCAAPFNATGEEHCLDDKAMEVVTGLLALKKHGGALPADIAPALAEFGEASLSVPLALARDSLEASIAAAAIKLGSLKGVLGDEAKSAELLDLGTKLLSINWPALPDFAKPLGSNSKLLSINWPALPDFAKLHDTVAAAVKSVPKKVVEDIKGVAPRCMRHCCKEEVLVDKDFQTPLVACPENYKFDIITLKCVAQGVQAGYAACPAGMQRCRISAWRRPLCAASNLISGVDSCELFEGLALAHKLPKNACPH